MLAFHDYYAHDLPPKMAPRQTIFPPLRHKQRAGS